MIEQLASLLLPIDALLHHEDFNPHQEPSSEIVTLFRNMWFLCVLFHFTNANEGDTTAMDWLKPTMSRIAVKTPSMVMEESHDAIASDVEYNSVIRQEYAHTVRIFTTVRLLFNVFKVISKHRSCLTGYIALRSGDIRYLSSGQIIFVLTMHDIESMRSATGLPSSLVSYFVNDGLNKHPGLSACMDSVAERVSWP